MQDRFDAKTTPSPAEEAHALSRRFNALGGLRSLIFGRALPTSRLSHEKLPNALALPIFSSDALSSNAYATEAILGVLAVVGPGALHIAFPIAIGISLLLAIVVISYIQIIHAYPDGGGAYPVSRDNLGINPALVAAASLLIDYVLTVATSVAAGVAAIITMATDIAATHPSFNHALVFLSNNIEGMCILSIVLITVGNIRGIRESGWAFAAPTYLFIFSLIATIIAGMIAVQVHAPYVSAAVLRGRELASQQMAFRTVGIYMVLQAFSQGCTALTGVEAISNTVPLFRQPQVKNAVTTMIWMGALAIVMFLGLTYLTGQFGIQPIDQSSPTYQSVVGLVANAAWPPALHFMFYVLQVSTALVLILAANTAFAGFPQLASMLARDNFLPRQLANLGDRLSFSNGITLLAVAACFLIYIFHGIVDDLLSLYAIGVFTSFTLAQAGMVRRWLRLKTKGWETGLACNFAGAIATGAVTLIIAYSKFKDGKVISSKFHFGHLYPHYGAWMVIVLVPVLVLMFRKINQHYKDMAAQLTVENYHPTVPSNNVVLVLVPRIHRGVVDALNYARLVSDDVRAVYVEVSPEATVRLKAAWEQWAQGIPLVIMESPYRSLIRPLLLYIDAVQKERSDDVVTVIVPEAVTRKWWHRILHNQAGPLLRFYLSSRKDVIVTNVRYFLER